jgi:hypothetical protein
MKKFIKTMVWMAWGAVACITLTATAPPCPESNAGYPVFFPDPTDCQYFYECDQGQAIRTKCPDGLHFNPQWNACGWPLENAVWCNSGGNWGPGGGGGGGSDNGGGVDQCDIFQYNRNYMEAWDPIELIVNVQGIATLTWRGVTYTIFKVGVGATVTVRAPICKSSPGNCCIKTHIDKPIQYP